MAKPTQDQLDKINQLSIKQLTDEDVYVFTDLMIDTLETYYHTELQPALLRTFMADAKQGVSLQLNHNWDALPAGRSYDARLVEDYIEGENDNVISLYGDFYIDLGRALETGISTDDVAKGIDSGVINYSSIGFAAEQWKCNICGNDIRDYWKCPHVPGRSYIVETDTGEEILKCKVLVGGNGEGELLENSLVYAGACRRASVTQNYNSSVTELRNSTKLHLVDNFKNIPLSAKLYQFYTKDGILFLTDTEERTGGVEYLLKRSETNVDFEQVKGILAKFDIAFESADELEEVLQKKFTVDSEDLSGLDELSKQVEELTTELVASKTENEKINGLLVSKDATIEELSKLNEELTAKAGLVETYHTDLLEKASGYAIRLNGNAFNADLYERYLKSLSIAELKEVVVELEKSVDASFEGYRKSESREQKLEKGEELTKADFEDEVEFRAYVAEKAIKYAKENDVSIVEATKLMYEKYSNDGSEN